MLTDWNRNRGTGKALNGAGRGGAGPIAACDERSGLDLHLVSDIAGFEALERDWNRLFERAGRSHQLFQGYNWNWHWCRTYLTAETNRKSPALSIVVGRSGGRPVMIWPLVSHRKLGVTYLCWMGNPVSQYGDVLVEDGPGRTAWLEEGWRFIHDGLGADLLCLPRIREDAAVAGLLRGLGLRPSAQAEAPCAELSAVAGYEAYAARFSASDRKNRRRQWRRLSEQGAVSIEFVSEGESAGIAAEQAIALKRRWLKRQGLASKAFADDRIDSFFVGAVTSSDRPAGCRVVVLRVGGRIAGAQIGIVCKGRHATHVSAYNLDPDFVRSAPGALVMDASIHDCLDRGLACYDLMAPGDAYKYEWADAAVTVCDYAIPLTPAGRLYAVVGACAHAAGKSAFEAAPGGLRRMILALAGLLP